MSRALFGLGPYGLVVAGVIGDGSNDFGTSDLNGFIISIASVRGDACAARRRRRPTSKSAIVMTITKKIYAPTIEPIWTGR